MVRACYVVQFSPLHFSIYTTIFHGPLKLGSPSDCWTCPPQCPLSLGAGRPPPPRCQGLSPRQALVKLPYSGGTKLSLRGKHLKTSFRNSTFYIFVSMIYTPRRKTQTESLAKRAAESGWKALARLSPTAARKTSRQKLRVCKLTSVLSKVQGLHRISEAKAGPWKKSSAPELFIPPSRWIKPAPMA